MQLRYVANRLSQLLLVMFGVSVLVFWMLRMIPGDPAQLLLGEYASPQALAELREKLGLNRSYAAQYGIYLVNIFQGDFGRSVRTGAPIFQEIWIRIPATVELAVAAMLIATLLGVAAGIISAVKHRSLWDYTAMFLALIGVSMPIFWLGLMLIYLFSVRLSLFPMMGRLSMGENLPVVTGLMIVDSLLSGNGTLLTDSIHHLILPAFTLSTIPMAIIARITRSSMLEVMHMDYIRTARAKGMGEATVILRHALRNACLPVITVIGLNLGLLLGGAVLTETIFSWPGLGRYVVDSLMARDYAAVQGCILMFAGMMAFINLVVDLIVALLDPRVRIHG